MPPKPKCTREEIALAAFEMIKSDGLAALTARDLGNKLGTSSRPIFTVFRNMEEVKMAARELALREFMEYISDYRDFSPAFKRIGMMMVSYGIHEPELFKLLFMQEHEERSSFEGTVRDLGEVADICIQLVQEEYETTESEARLVFESMWTQAYGLGVMCATGVCDFSEDEIGRRLGLMFMSLMTFIKSGKVTEIHSDVEKNGEGLYHGHRLGDVPKI